LGGVFFFEWAFFQKKHVFLGLELITSTLIMQQPLQHAPNQKQPLHKNLDLVQYWKPKWTTYQPATAEYCLQFHCLQFISLNELVSTKCKWF